jgi:hypothetical protein
MVYNVTLSDTSTVKTFADGVIDSSQFSISIVGKNVAGYGETIATSFIHLLENFAHSSSPANPTLGQLWFDTATAGGTMKVYTGTWESLITGGASGDFTVSGNLLPAADCGVNPPYSDIGSASLRFCTVYANTFDGNVFTGVSTQARYADVAERFEADAVYDYGTVVKLGGEKEVTATDSSADLEVFGIVSQNPALLMNMDAGDDGTHPPVALAGRVPVKLEGSVKKGQRLVSGTLPGHAMALEDPTSVSSLAIIGRALEDSDGGMVLAVVGVK